MKRPRLTHPLVLLALLVTQAFWLVAAALPPDPADPPHDQIAVVITISATGVSPSSTTIQPGVIRWQNTTGFPAKVASGQLYSNFLPLANHGIGPVSIPLAARSGGHYGAQAATFIFTVPPNSSTDMAISEEGQYRYTVNLGSGSVLTGELFVQHAVITPTPTPTSAPSGWSTQPYPGNGLLRGISMLSSTDGWAVGDNAVIVRDSVNGWVSQSVPSDVATLRGVDARSGVFAFAVGDLGIAMTWNGTNWTDQFNGTVPDFQAVSLAPGTITDGWLAGNNGSVYRWNGAGFNDGLLLPSASTSTRVRDVYTVSSSEAYAVTGDGNNGIYRYNGSTWIKMFTASRSLNAIAFVGSTGYAVGDNGLIVRYDGSAWTESGSPTGFALNAVAMLNETEGWAVGDAGVILRLLNGGWTAYPSPTSANLRDVSIVSSREAWAVGDSVMLRYTAP